MFKQGCYPRADVFAYPVESRLKQMSCLRACFITIIYIIVRAWATLYYMHYFQKRNKAKIHCHFVKGLYMLQSLPDPYDTVPCLFGPLPPPRLDLWRNLRALKPPLIPDMPIHTTPPPGPPLCPVNITQKMSKHCQTLKSTKSLPKNSLYSLFCGYLNQHGNICSTCRRFLVQRRRTSGNTSGLVSHIIMIFYFSE